MSAHEGGGFLGWLVGKAVLVVRLLLVLAGRYLRGLPLDGEARDNSTLLYAATKDYRDAPYEKLSGPLWHRLARRWLFTGIPLGLLVVQAGAQLVRAGAYFLERPAPAWAGVPWLALAVGWELLAGAAGVAWAARTLIRYVRARTVVADFTVPAALAVCDVLQLNYSKRLALGMVEIPAGYTPVQKIDDPVGRYRQGSWLDRRQGKRRLEIQLAYEATVPIGEDPDPAKPTPEQARRWRWRRVRGVSLPVEAEPPPVRINLPRGSKCSQKQIANKLLAQVGAALGMPDPVGDWHLGGRRPYVDIRPTLPPPPELTFAQVRKWVAGKGCRLDRLVCGLSAGNRPEYVDYANDSPHLLFSGGSGTGKSTLMKFLLCQRRRFGAWVLICDFKRVSHRWAHGRMPGVAYCWRIAEIHDALVVVGQELAWRKEMVLPEGNPYGVPLREFVTLDVVIEEANSTASQLQAYWHSIGGVGVSPAVMAMQGIANEGRQYSIHEYVGAQRASARTFGPNGGDVRENFWARFMAQWTVQAWRMLAGGPFVRCPPGRGIWARVLGDVVAIIRVPNLTDDEAREWGMEGPVPVPEGPLAELLDLVLGDPTGRPALGGRAGGAPELVSLSAALPLLPGPAMTIHAIRQARQRSVKAGDGLFPESVGEVGAALTFDLRELIGWKQLRDRDTQIAQLESQLELAEPRRHGIVYRWDILDEETGAVVCGYIGQTTRRLETREREHRTWQPWIDLVVGESYIIWEGDPTQAELDRIELDFIHKLRPRFNWEGQEGAEWAVPPERAKEERWARDKARGRTPWRQVDSFVPGMA